MRALQIANETRLGRKRLRRQIAGGEMSAAEVILAPPREAERWPLVELLSSQRYWGQAKSQKFLATAQIDGRKPVGQLTDRQRKLLVTQLARRSERITTSQVRMQQSRS